MTTVTNQAELLAALETTKGGDIVLEPGNYGELNLRSDKQPFIRFENEVVIISEDPENPAVFDGMRLRQVKNLTIVDVVLDYDFADGDRYWASPVLLEGCSDVKFDLCIFDGDVAVGVDAIADDFGTARGLMVREYDGANSKNITISNCIFQTWLRAAIFMKVDGLTVTSNDVHSIREDGFRFVEVTNVRIEENHMHDFKGSPNSKDHRDFIQFWTTNARTPTTDIVIRGNKLNSAAGSYTQSIFMRNEAVDRDGAGDEMFYKNITIEDNTIHNGHLHGITVGEADGLTIRGNTLLWNVDSEIKDANTSTPGIRLNEKSRAVTIDGNLSPREIAVGNKLIFNVVIPDDWSVGDNLVVQYEDSAGDNYVGDLIVNPLAGANATLADLARKSAYGDGLPASLFVMGADGELVEYTRVTA